MNTRNRPLWLVMFDALRRVNIDDVIGLAAILVMLVGALVVSAGIDPSALMNEVAR